MNIRVGPFDYAVRLVRGHIDHDGEPCYGLCDHVRQEILLSDVPPPRQRLQVFFHELMHAWWYHFHTDAGDEEAVADLVGVAMTDFMLQATAVLRQQGGELRLFTSEPDDTTADAMLGALREHGTATQQPRRAAPTAVVRADTGDDMCPTAVAREGRWTIRIFDRELTAGE